MLAHHHKILRISMDMEIRLKIRKAGNSLMIATQIVKDLKLKAGDDMLFDIIDSTISVKKEKR
jgi:antitoxin component of MazEF toxin-antitoxin module